MPVIGLKHLVTAPYVETNGVVSYGTGRVLAGAVNVNVAVESNDTRFYTDDVESDSDFSFKNAKISAGIDDLEPVACNEVLGHTINGSDELVSNSGDQAPYRGVGFYARKKRNGVISWRAIWLKKVKFKIPTIEMETKGESIAFKGSTVEGSAVEDVNGEWKVEKTFTTEAAATAWLDGKANLATRVAMPVASVAGGTYAASQSVTLSCATAGAAIKYTIDGTTPTASHGTTYSTAITVSASTVLRAIATKSSMDNSDIMYHEYTITA
jgi:phi13 family phage major tail protein